MILRKLFSHQHTLYYAAAILLAAVMFLIVIVDPLKYPIARFLAGGGSVVGLPKYAVSLFTPVHVLGVLVLGAFFILIIRLERKSRAVSLALLEGDNLSFYVFAAALLVWFSQAFLYSGVLLGGDSNFHIARIAHFRYGLEEGKVIYWNNYWHLSMPEYQFTGPLLFWLGGVVDLLFRDPHLSTKLILFLAQFASGAFLFAYLRILRIHRFAALIGAIAYCGAWTHLHMLLYKGALPQAIIFALLPLGLLQIEKLAAIGRHATWHWPALATVLAALFINHPTNGFFAAFYLALYTLINLLVGRFAWRTVWPMLSAAVAAVSMSLFLLIPIKLEQDWVTMMPSSWIIGLAWPKLESLSNLVVWHYGNTGTGSNFFAYIGLSVLALALMGLRGLHSADSDRKRLVIVLLILWPASFFLVGPHVRQPIFILLFTAILAGIGADGIVWKKSGVKPALLVLIMWFDLGVIAIQPVARIDKGYFADGAAELARNYSSTRVLVASSYTGKLNIPIWDGSLMMGYKVQQLGIPFAYSVPMSHNYVAAVIKQAEKDLQVHHRLSGSSVRMLSLINVGWIINDTGTGLGFSDQYPEAVPAGALGKAIRVPGAVPVVFSNKLEHRPPAKILDKPMLWNEEFIPPYSSQATQVDQYVKRVITEMGSGPASNNVEKIFVRDDLPPGMRDGPARILARVSEYKVDIDQVVIKLESDGAGWARFAHAWYPALRITRNGVTIQAMQDVMGQIVVPVSPGINEYSITPTLTDIRHTTLWISAAALLAVWVFAWALRRFQNREKPKHTGVEFRI